jgi:hypothetical protein
MILAAPFDAPHLKELVSFTDGLVIVGENAPADVAVAQALAWLRPRRQGAAPAPARAVSVPMLAPPKPIERAKLIAGIAGIGLALLIAASMFWFARRPFAGEKPVRAVSESKPSAPVAAPILRDTIRTVFTAPGDSAVRDSGAAPIDQFAVLPITNPGDSARAAAWSVRLEQTNTPSAAILDLRGRFETVPAGTYGFDDLRTRFILLVAGAYTARAGADSLLAQLRQHRTLAPDNGSVISLPFAFLVQQDVPPAELPQRLKRFAASGKPVYALRQPSGAWHMYYGAYASPQHAALALAAVRDAGLTPTLVYRIGRVD